MSHSRRWSDFEEYLIPRPRWINERAQHYAALELPLDADGYLSQLNEQLKGVTATVDRRAPNNNGCPRRQEREGDLVIPAGFVRGLTKPMCPRLEIDSAAKSTLKRGFWGESRLAFESIVEEVRRFVARMPPVDYSAGSACYLRNFSALGDQRAEILPVQRPRTLSLSARRMMRLTRILIFPYFSLSITDQLPPTSRGFPQCPEKLSLETRKGRTRFLFSESFAIIEPARQVEVST